MKTQQLLLLVVVIFFVLLIYISRMQQQGAINQSSPSPTVLPVSPTRSVQTVIVPLLTEVAIDAGAVGLKALEIKIPASNCPDCMMYARVQVRSDIATQTLTFRDGGIAGNRIAPQEAYGYVFDLESMSKDSVKLRYQKK